MFQLLLPFLLLCLSASAEQLAFRVDKKTAAWSFETSWSDAAGQRHAASFSLPADLVRADLDEPLHFKKRDAAQEAAGAVNQWAAGQSGPKVTASVGNGGSVQIRATGKSRARINQALAAAVSVRDVATAHYLQEHGFISLNGAILPDHLRHVAEYADDLAPVVQALGGPGGDPREFAALALSMVQSIPYEKLATTRDRYRRPLSLLGRNRGDCDSKSTLFLALMHQAWPEVPLAMVYVPNHALVGLGLEPLHGEVQLRHEGATWLLAEPVGPRLAVLGEVPAKHRRQAKGRRGRVLVLNAG